MGQGTLGIALGLVARRRQLGDAIFQRRIAHIDDAVLDRVIEALELLGRTTLKMGDMLSALVHPLVPPFEDLIHRSFEPCRVEQPILEMIDRRDEQSEDEQAEDEQTGKPISDSLIRDLSAHRTLALRVALCVRPDLAVVALTHTLTPEQSDCSVITAHEDES